MVLAGKPSRNPDLPAGRRRQTTHPPIPPDLVGRVVAEALAPGAPA